MDNLFNVTDIIPEVSKHLDPKSEAMFLLTFRIYDFSEELSTIKVKPIDIIIDRLCDELYSPELLLLKNRYVYTTNQEWINFYMKITNRIFLSMQGLTKFANHGTSNYIEKNYMNHEQIGIQHKIYMYILMYLYAIRYKYLYNDCTIIIKLFWRVFKNLKYLREGTTILTYDDIDCDIFYTPEEFEDYVDRTYKNFIDQRFHIW